MKFHAVIGGSKNVEAFSKLVHIVSKLCKKKCIIRLSSDEFSFLNTNTVREAFYLDFRIIQKELFVSYNIEGHSQNTNVIFFEISTDDLLQSVAVNENTMELKISHINMIPHLVIELKSVCITHEIPITFILQHNWLDYEPPSVGLASVCVGLPSVKVFHKILNSVKNIGSKTITISANNNGELYIDGVVDQAKLKVYLHDIANYPIHGANSEEMPAVDHLFSVQLDLRLVYSFMSVLHVYFNQAILKIYDGRVAVFSAKQQSCQFKLFVNGLQGD
ncbi:hus1-like protein [Ditylenchus destructor]|nr:hus1-like protein [Ditylenchus destructor]